RAQHAATGLVRCRAADAAAAPSAGVEKLAHVCDPRAEAKVRGRTVRDADALGAEAFDLRLREMDAVSAPDILRQPADALAVLDRRSAVGRLPVNHLLDCLGQVRR